MTINELLEELSGLEILSLDWEQCVVIENGKICGTGLEVLEGKPTKAQLQALLDEAIAEEYGAYLLSFISDAQFKQEMARRRGLV